MYVALTEKWPRSFGNIARNFTCLIIVSFMSQGNVIFAIQLSNCRWNTRRGWSIYLHDSFDIYICISGTHNDIYSDELCDRKIYVPRLLLLCVPGKKRQVQRCFTWWFICNKNLCVTFVNLLENQQTPLYWTLYILHIYKRPNQYAVK